MPWTGTPPSIARRITSNTASGPALASRQSSSSIHAGVAFPAVTKISTRIGMVDAQTLLLDVTDQIPKCHDDLDFELGQIGEHVGVGKYRV